MVIRNYHWLNSGVKATSGVINLFHTGSVAARLSAAARAAGRLPREDPREEVGEEVRVGVGVRVGPVELKLYVTVNGPARHASLLLHRTTAYGAAVWSRAAPCRAVPCRTGSGVKKP